MHTHPEYRSATTKDQVGREADVQKRERRLRDKDIEKLLEEYGYLKESGIKFYKTIKQAISAHPDDEVGKVEYERITLYKFPVKTHFSERRLPKGYLYKGGAARALLGRALGTDTQVPRDVDIVRFGEEPQPGMDKQIEQEFSPEDAALGGGVEWMMEARYFFTRDVTLNEVVASDTEIVASAECVLDTVRRIIRMAPYEREKYEGEEGTPDQKILARMMLFYAEHIERYDEAAFDTSTDKQLESAFISPFYMAVQLDKACQKGGNVARHYIDEIRKRGQVPEYLESIEDVAGYLLSLMRKDNFYYRHAPSVQFEREEEQIEEKYGDLNDEHAARRERGVRIQSR